MTIQLKFDSLLVQQQFLVNMQLERSAFLRVRVNFRMDMNTVSSIHDFNCDKYIHSNPFLHFSQIPSTFREINTSHMSYKRMKQRILLFLVAFLVSTTSLFAQSGRLDGTVLDADTDEPLIGVNIYIQELEIGAATNVDGYFSVINVRPGIYTIRVSMIGFSTVVTNDVRINIGQTTSLEIFLREEVFSGEELTVFAERPVVQRDVSSSQVNLNADEIRNLPVASVDNVVSLQAGVQGQSFRGGNSTELSFNVNGLSLRDERNNTPFTAIGLTSVSEIQVQSGGFRAEYGDVQSGIVNVITKEGSRTKYEFDILYRHNPPTQKHFDEPVNHPNSYWIRPYVDDAVAWTGTNNGEWDEWTKKQYAAFPEGWIGISERTMQDPDPNKHLTPQAAQQLFLWQHRKEMAITQPDYDLEMSFGGPVPFVSERLGNLRFFTTYRRSQNMYVIPLSRDRQADFSLYGKVTSDVARGMKLTIESLYGEQIGTNSNNSGAAGMFSSVGGIAGNVNNANSFGDSRIFSSDYWAPTQVNRLMIGGKFTHSVSNNSFYEVTTTYFRSKYDTNPSPRRDTTGVRLFGNSFMADEAPFGFWPFTSEGIGSGMRMGAGMSNSRDSSMVAYLNLRFDYTNQLNRYNQLKTGVQFVRTDSRVNYASIDEVFVSGRSRSKWETTPVRGAVYAQNKIEFQEVVADIGLRLDYSHAGGEWFVYDPFDQGFLDAQNNPIEEVFETSPTKHIFTLSPRIGVSFPITVNSKLYFNYGHFRSMPVPENLYLVQRFVDNEAIARLANPNNPLPKSVAYELGYEHSLFDQYLIRVAGYYQDRSDRPLLVRYTNRNNAISYTTNLPNGYQDIRGLEFTLSKNRGQWFQGFVNYTYMVTSSGRFGFPTIFENPAEQRRLEREDRSNIQSKPIPRPYARMNLDFFTPREFGPSLGGFKPLADWRIGLLASWQAGYYFSWSGGTGSIPGLINNVQWKDSYNVNMRMSRTIAVEGRRINFFMDVNNVLNTRYLTRNGVTTGQDFVDYMQSLHLPQSVLNELAEYSAFYATVPGSDRPGDYRKPGVNFVPIVSTGNVNSINNPHERPLYYDQATKQYFQYRNGQMVTADQSFVNQVLNDKAYIDMPNLRAFNFLNPRNFIFGLRLTF